MLKYEIPKTSPESVGMRSDDAARFITGLEERLIKPHGMIVYRHGQIAFEAYWNPYGPSYRHDVFSVSKSFTSIAVGIAVSEGILALDDKVVSFFPELVPKNAGDYLKSMTVSHLLNMTSGHGFCTFDRIIEGGYKNWLSAFFNIPVLHEPGTLFCYDAALSYVLGAIIERVSGLSLVEFLRPRLLNPIYIHDPIWDECPRGLALAGMGLSITLQDLLNFGILTSERNI